MADLERMLNNSITGAENLESILLEVEDTTNRISNSSQGINRMTSTAQQVSSTQQRGANQSKQAWSSAFSSMQSGIKSVLSTTRSIVQGVTNSVKTVLRQFKEMIGVLGQVGKGMMNAFKNGGTYIKSLISHARRLLTLFGNFGNTISRIFNNTYVESGTSLLASIRSLNSTIGNDLTDNTIEWANKLENAFGISASGLITQLSSINAFLQGSGFSGEQTAIAGKNVLTSANILSGITGYSFDETISKLQSGFKGMTASVDDLGISFRKNDVTEFLEGLKAQGGEFANLETNLSKLTLTQRTYVYYAMLMNQMHQRSSTLIQDYVAGLNTASGRINTLKYTVSDLITNVGILLTKLIGQHLLPLLHILRQVKVYIQGLAKSLNIDISLSSHTNDLDTITKDTNAGKGFEVIEESATDASKAVDGVADSIEKAKGALDSWDNVTSMSTSKTSSNLGNTLADSFDYSKLMGLEDDLYKELEKAADEANETIWENAEKEFNKFKKQVEDWLGKKLGRNINLSDLAKRIKETLTIGFTGISSLYGVSDTSNTWQNIYKIALDIHKVFESIGGIVSGIIKSSLSWLENGGAERIANITDKISAFFNTNSDKIISIISSLGELAFDVAQILIDSLLDFFNNGGLDIIKQIVTDISTFINQNKEALMSIISNLLLMSFDVLQLLVNTLLKVIQNGGLDTLKEFTERLNKLLNENGSTISDILSTLIVSALKIATNAILAVLQFIVDNEATIQAWTKDISNLISKILENPESVKTIVNTIIQMLGALAVAKVVTGVANIIKLINTISGLSTATAVSSVPSAVAGGAAASKATSNAALAGAGAGGSALVTGSITALPFALGAFVGAKGLSDLNKGLKEDKVPHDYAINMINQWHEKKGTIQTQEQYDVFRDSCIKGLEKIGASDDIIKKTIENVNTELKLSFWTHGRKIFNGKNIKTYANGGIPRTGSLFVANEAGAELVGNFGGYTGVANQGMIIDAMKQAIKEAMGSGQNSQTVNVCQGGVFVGDDTSIRKLAQMLQKSNIRYSSNVSVM